MTSLSALILQDPGLYRTVASISLQRIGYGSVTEISHSGQALDRLRELGGVQLLLCDLRIEPVARLDFLKAVAREHLAQGVLIVGQPAPGTWPALARLLRLQGLQVFRLTNGPATHENLQALLADFDPHGTNTPSLPTLSETPSDHEVAGALGNGELRAALQPKVEVASGHVCGFEVLARWQRADGNILLPGTFLPALRRTALLDALLFTLMDQATSELLAHGCAHLGLAFNLEPSQVAQPGFAQRVEHQLRRQSVDPRRITFELTESGLLQAPAVSLDNLLRLRLLGCGLAIDDFGKGHSTLQRLVDLPFTELKLDACFLAELDEDPRRHAVLASALALGRALDLPVVAEGVENANQLRHLQQLGCDLAQGNFLGKPVMGGALARLLREIDDKRETRRHR